MIELTLREVEAATGGVLRGADPHTRVTGSVEFDSRRIGPGGLFLAFAGEHVDGHDFVAAAISAGAVAAVVTRPVEAPHLLVDDGRAALAGLATEVARRLPATIVGITGSSGKTSTKDLVAVLLERIGPTVAPPGSYNNELGHPYTVLRADRSTRFLVLENSARGAGHIRALTLIARPEIGVVLNVGSAHLGEFGSREAIAQAKGELVEALPPAVEGGVAVLNVDDPLVAAMARRTAARVRTVGEASEAEIRAERVALDDLGRASFQLVTPVGSTAVSLPLVGAHHVGNALAAAAVALECGLSLDAIAEVLADARPRSRWRMELVERLDGVLVINDAYNANPESVRAAVKALAAIGRARSARTVAVLGEMAELGVEAPAEHDAIGRLAVRLDISRLIAVGAAARPIAHGAALEGSWAGESTWVADPDEALGLLRAELRPGDVVLVKASRAASLDRLAAALGEDGSAVGPAVAGEAGIGRPERRTGQQ
jgi:UDP-N-acetylmuramoyl-tripeptide--D-alanyl-D-alanine ligase